MIGSDELPADKGLKAVFPRLGVLDVNALEDARPVGQLGGREPGAVRVV